MIEGAAMSEPRRLKKSESLEVRIPYPTKQAFMARCRADGVSASEAVRGFIEGRLAAPPKMAPRRGLRLAAGLLAAAAVGAMALPSLARPGPAADFARLDLNGDGKITPAEFARLDRDGDGAVSFGELSARP
jgi:hypothetical protein